MIGASLFKSGSEKLSGRLADLETEAASLEKRATEARGAAADAQARLVEDLAEGLPVDDWRKKREAAEKKAADAERDLAAALEAAELVRAKLEAAQAAEVLESLRKRHAEAEKRLPGVVAALVKAGQSFSIAASDLEGLRSEVDSVHFQLRQAGDRQTQVLGVPLAENLLADELPAMNGGNEGRQTFRVGLPIWPYRTNP
jgi:chromosome segregation ATPase